MSDYKDIDYLALDIISEMCLFGASIRLKIPDCTNHDLLEFLHNHKNDCLYIKNNNRVYQPCPFNKLSEERFAKRILLIENSDNVRFKVNFCTCGVSVNNIIPMIAIEIFGPGFFKRLYFYHDASFINDFLISGGILKEFKVDINQTKKKYSSREDSMISLVSNLV